jgi:hypothetical protein
MVDGAGIRVKPRRNPGGRRRAPNAFSVERATAPRTDGGPARLPRTPQFLRLDHEARSAPALLRPRAAPRPRGGAGLPRSPSGSAHGGRCLRLLGRGRRRQRPLGHLRRLDFRAGLLRHVAGGCGPGSERSRLVHSTVGAAGNSAPAWTSALRASPSVRGVSRATRRRRGSARSTSTSAMRRATGAKRPSWKPPTSRTTTRPARKSPSTGTSWRPARRSTTTTAPPRVRATCSSGTRVAPGARSPVVARRRSQLRQRRRLHGGRFADRCPG